MKCCVCKNREATVHLTQIAGDKVHKVDLCEECAKNKGVNDPTGFSLADLLLGLGAAQQVDEAAGGVEMRCRRCGFTQADLKKAGRLGCPDCYRTFADALEGLLKSMHKGTRHVGKVPAALRQVEDTRELIKQLQKQLAKAIEEEQFEQAAVLRDAIKQATAQLANAATPNKP